MGLPDQRIWELGVLCGLTPSNPKFSFPTSFQTLAISSIRNPSPKKEEQQRRETLSEKIEKKGRENVSPCVRSFKRFE
ncbi:hypothetical protein M6B38_164860 [Iris pallida]|uniref:Uncharacterized protein n=1 Tax=Iris pallida TaxID=29817 RepID=A0AAX6EZ37_IRIPA|nr:hypothetical protein M6B38_164860 [Iris pallida]